MWRNVRKSVDNVLIFFGVGIAALSGCDFTDPEPSLEDKQIDRAENIIALTL